LEKRCEEAEQRGHVMVGHCKEVGGSGGGDKETRERKCRSMLSPSMKAAPHGSKLYIKLQGYKIPLDHTGISLPQSHVSGRVLMYHAP